MLSKKNAVLKKEDYRFGIIRRGENGSKGICNCGNVITNTNYHQSKFACEKCANDFFIPAQNYLGERFTVPYLHSLRRDNKGFKVKRINLSIHLKDDVITPIRENLTRTMDFDIVEQRLQVWREDVLEFDGTQMSGTGHIGTKSNAQFFTLLDQDTFLDFVSNEVTRDLFAISKDEGYINYYKSNLMEGFRKLMLSSNQYLQVLANAGIPEVGRFRPSWRKEEDVVHKEETKPNKILGLPKYMMPYIRQDVSITIKSLGALQNATKRVDAGKFKEIMSVVKDESTMLELIKCLDNVIQIHLDYEYTNLQKLVLYLFREVRLTQGIKSPSNATTYLRDYIRMSRTMGLEWEKYPRSLKKEHDVVMMNYNMMSENADTKKKFDLSLSKPSYQMLAFEDKKEDFSIILPKEAKELIKEGNELSHCVSSYVEDIMNDKCKIFFLRNKEEIEKPLVTIEVRGFNIRQARGFGNRAVSEEQKEFIKKWAEKKTLVEAYY